MRLCWRWIVDDTCSEKDITDKKLILFGCGNFIYEYTRDMQLNDFLVVDGGGTKKYGTSILLNNKLYVINEPEILRDLDVTKYYVVITVQKPEVVSEIMQMIEYEYPQWSNHVCLHSQLRRSYPNIVSGLLCDPLIHRKIDKGHIATKLPEYIAKANDILARYITDQESKLDFSSVRFSSRVIFFVKYNDEKYLLYFPYNDGSFFYSESNLRQNYEIRKRLRINEELIIYETPDGFVLSRFMKSKKDFSDKNLISAIMRKIRNIHESGEIIDAKMGVHAGVNVLEDELNIDENSLDGYVGKLHRLIIPETRIYKEKIIHGDLSWGNILHSDDHIEIIDWTFMQMGDPLFDVCTFYYFVTRHWIHDFAEVLVMYYERELSDVEYRHALAWLILVLYWKYLWEIKNHGTQKEKLLNELKQLIDEYTE